MATTKVDKTTSSTTTPNGPGWKGLLIELALVAIGLPLAVLLWGEEMERQVWAATPSTLGFYATDEVCAEEGEGRILNCGQCGHCSNRADVRIYKETSETLTGIMTECAREDFFLGKDPYYCLQSQTNLTDGCTRCWIDNYECNINSCLATCVKERFLAFVPALGDWSDARPLSNCHACDERLCGPAFVGCAGANRRRVGVVSDIERDAEREICGKVDWEWILGSGHGTGDAGPTPMAAVGAEL